jgi:hypothetical protein
LSDEPQWLPSCGGKQVLLVSLIYHVEFDKHFYSVPHRLIHKQIDIRATGHMVEIFHQGKIVAVHVRNYRSGRFSTQHDHMPSNHRFVADLTAEGLIRGANKIGPQTTNLIKATLKSRRYTEQAFRTCLGILNLAQKQDTRLLEQACQVVYEIKAFSYQAVKQELNLLYEQVETSEIEKLPTHENVRGAEYYQKRNK